jgi:CBS domain-containing protein
VTQVAAFPDDHISDAELLIGAKKGLYDRSRLLSPEATLATILDLKGWITQELAFEEGASASFGRILSELWHAEYLDQLPPLLNRFERLVSAYFVRRGSVPAFHGFCSAWRDGVLRRILQFAEEGPELNDQGHAPGPYALLASGSTGRREQTLEETERYFLVWGGNDHAYFEPFAYRVMAILDHYALIGKEGSSALSKALWRGNLADWSGYLEAEQRASEQPGCLEILADLRHLSGDEAIGHEAVRQARSLLERVGEHAEFQDTARQVIEAPVALGLMGGIRVEKAGDHVGCCNPEKAGLDPLVSAARLLSAQYQLEPGSTLDRLAALGELGIFEAAQLEQIVAAYHLLAGMKVRREIALESAYFDPASLSEGEREKLKGALEAVRQLQRVARNVFFGKERTSRVVV